MKVAEQAIPAPKGHWKLNIYEGDVVREPLEKWQIIENADFKAQFPELPFPLHIGNIVSKVVEVIEGDNLVTTVGKGLYLDRLFAMGGPPAALTHMGVGASATAATIGDTQLNTTPTLLAFDALPSRAGLVVTATRTFATGEANINWQEIALFNGGTNGTSLMFNRIAPIGAFNKTSAVSIGASVTITQA